MVAISDVKCRVHLVYAISTSTITIKLVISIQCCYSLKLVRTVSVIARFFGVAHKMRSPYIIDTSISKSKNF
jgi:hypothetical protein